MGPCHYHETKRSLAASGSFTFCLRLRFRRGGQRGPRAGFGAWCGPQGVVLLVRLARVCDSGLNGRFPVAQGAAVGDRGSETVGFLA